MPEEAVPEVAAPEVAAAVPEVAAAVPEEVAPEVAAAVALELAAAVALELAAAVALELAALELAAAPALRRAAPVRARQQLQEPKQAAPSAMPAAPASRHRQRVDRLAVQPREAAQADPPGLPVRSAFGTRHGPTPCAASISDARRSAARPIA